MLRKEMKSERRTSKANAYFKKDRKKERIYKLQHTFLDCYKNASGLK